MKKIFLVFTLLLIGLLSLVSCASKNEQNIEQKNNSNLILIKSQITETCSAPSSDRIKKKYFFSFYEKEKYNIEVDENIYSSYNVGDYYTITMPDTEDNRMYISQYFYSSSIIYVKEYEVAENK